MQWACVGMELSEVLAANFRHTVQETEAGTKSCVRGEVCSAYWSPFQRMWGGRIFTALPGFQTIFWPDEIRFACLFVSMPAPLWTTQTLLEQNKVLCSSCIPKVVSHLNTKRQRDIYYKLKQRQSVLHKISGTPRSCIRKELTYSRVTHRNLWNNSTDAQ